MAFSSNGRYVAGADYYQLDIWDLETQQIIAQFPLDVFWPEILIFSPDDKYVAVTGEDGTQLFDWIENRETP